MHLKRRSPLFMSKLGFDEEPDDMISTLSNQGEIVLCDSTLGRRRIEDGMRQPTRRTYTRLFILRERGGAIQSCFAALLHPHPGHVGDWHDTCSRLQGLWQHAFDREDTLRLLTH